MRYLLVMILIFAGCATNKPVDPSTVNNKSNDTKYLLKQAATHIKKRMPQKAVNDYLIPLSKLCQQKTSIKGKRVLCSTNQKETQFYLLSKVFDKKDTIVIEPTCAYGYFLMGYSYLEMRMNGKALIYLKKALELSPANSEFLSELAYVYQIGKNWEKSLDLYEQAEKMAEFSTDRYMVAHIGRALRGQGYSLIEMGKLDEAEKKYQKCLRINRNDRKALNELRYINKLRGK